MPRRDDAGLTVLLGALVAFGPLAVDMYLPALPALAAGLGASIDAAQGSITVFLAGFALGMLFYGPLSDHYGRRRVMLGGIALFAVTSLACLLATSLPQLLLARALQALGGGAASVLARAVVRDRFEGAEAIRRLSLMAMVTALAPLVAPLAGSLLLRGFGWRGTFGALTLWGLLCLAVVWRRLPESLPPERRGGQTLGRAFGAYRALLSHPPALGLVLAGGMSFAAMFAYITAAPFYFITLHGFSPLRFGTVFACNALGILAANYANSRLARRVGAQRLAGIGTVGGLLGAVLLFATRDAAGALPAALAGLFVVVGVTGLLGANCVGLLMNRYPQSAGAAAAVFGAAQFGFGMAASALVDRLHDGTGGPMAEVILGASAVSLAGYLLYHGATRRENAPREAARR